MEKQRNHIYKKRAIKLYVLLLFSFFSFSQNIIDIQFEGQPKLKTTKHTLDKIIKSQLNQPLDSIKLKQDAVRLTRLATYNKSSYEVVPVGKDYKVIFKVKSVTTLFPSLNIWTSNTQNIAYQIGVKEQNFLNSSKEIGFFYRNNGYHSASFSYTDPYLINRHSGLSFTAQSLTSVEPLFFKNGNSAEYEYTNASLELMYLNRLNFFHSIGLGINFFNEDYQFKQGDISNDVPSTLKQNKLLSKLRYQYNNLAYDYHHVSGFKSELYVQYVLPIAENQQSFWIGWNDFFYYHRVGLKGNFANRLRLGISTNEESPFAPFSVDNNLNLRGVGNIIDRGTAVIVLNSEYRYDLINNMYFTLQGNAFIDAGTWRLPGRGFDSLLENGNVRMHPGIGLRFINKRIWNATFRIDYGVGVLNDKSEGIVFGLGQYF